MDNAPLDEEAIFHTARKIENPEARAEYLAQICAGDLRLRERVEALLRVNEEDGKFLQPAAECTTTVGLSETDLVGRTIDRYKLLQQIGRGGFGVVYMAEQEQPIRRKVALKLSFPGRDSQQVIARFEAERQALSLMDHPNIARVFDTRSDIYSLGVVLYELLVGELPFDRERFRTSSIDEILRIIREEDPPKPSLRLTSSRQLTQNAGKLLTGGLWDNKVHIRRLRPEAEPKKNAWPLSGSEL